MKYEEKGNKGYSLGNFSEDRLAYLINAKIRKIRSLG